jgi:hypothetical protein
MPLHHFLPRFYLKQWLDPASVAPNRTPYLWKISRNGQQRRRRHPAHRDFSIEDGNTLESVTGERTERVENLLARLEAVVAGVLRDCVPHRVPLDRDQADALNMFFSSMLVRVPAARAVWQAGVAAAARIERETAEANDRPVPDTRLYEANAAAHFAHSALVAVLPELDVMTHRIVRAPTGESFITSDRPALIWAPVGFVGLANRYCEVTLPLSPQALLLMTHEGVNASGYVDAQAADVLAWNRRTRAQCSEWFISERREADWFDSPAP